MWNLEEPLDRGRVGSLAAGPDAVVSLAHVMGDTTRRRDLMAYAQTSLQLFNQMRQAGYSDAQIVEIVLNVAFNVVTNYVNEAFQIDIDFPRVAPATRVA